MNGMYVGMFVWLVLAVIVGLWLSHKFGIGGA